MSSHIAATTRRLNPLLEDIGHNLPKKLSVATNSADSGFRDMLNQKIQSPEELYLQTLRDYIAERSGSLAEGWHVEFEFSEERCKTSAVYVAPDRSRLKSMEDVAQHLGLTSRHCCLEAENRSNGYAFISSRLKADPAKEGMRGIGFPVNSSRQDGFPVSAALTTTGT